MPPRASSGAAATVSEARAIVARPCRPAVGASRAPAPALAARRGRRPPTPAAAAFRGPPPPPLDAEDNVTPVTTSATPWTATAFTLASLLVTLPALAAPPVAYDPAAGSDALKNVAGVAYVVLLVVFAFRLLRRRADTATRTRFAAPPPAEGVVARPRVKATSARAAW